MSKHPLFIAIPAAIAILVVLTPTDALPTVAVAAGAVAAAAIGLVLAWNTRPRATAFGRGRAFLVVQSEPMQGGGTLLAVQFEDRLLLVGATRHSCRVLAGTGLPAVEDVVESSPATADPTVAEKEVVVIPAEPKESDALARFRALSARQPVESEA
ncbi:MAG: hypothetical protein U1F36_15545 [Planctomycetota bacterium]